ncbi:hypothetical protein [Deinococcus yavapaiensis]|uniref:Tetratricopeptide repeat protein n=1 Tax=Deinococcus yavapaiensis KR-236 TaxID=694435 RepID=A0A318SBZ9_9DEIO|nr:hypothetical protein [Deinococcus yavapaiensis]PYE56351.1 hypothetical protein DES52_101155 [Deinococcus yavapaiensis KR-236]
MSAEIAHVVALVHAGKLREAARLLEQLPMSARVLVLRARVTKAPADALAARDLARLEGDAPALVAAAALLGELHLSAAEPRLALHALAEGLKVAEVTGEAADAYLLAVLALAQARVGSPSKAALTAEKALIRAALGSPARVLALRALGRHEEARRDAAEGGVGAEFFVAEA